VLIEAVTIIVMSGVDDGTEYRFKARSDGHILDDQWVISIGRKENNDLCLKRDTFISRHHARLFWKDDRWWLEDNKSTNGTFTENADNMFEDHKVSGIIPIQPGELFRVGRTWLRIQA